MTTALDLNEFEQLCNRGYESISRLTANKLIEEIKRLKRGDLTREEFDIIWEKFDEKRERGEIKMTTTALDLNEMKRIVSYINVEAHKMHAERLIEEVERLRRFDLTNEEFRDFTTKYGVFDGPTGTQFVAVKIPEGYELACREMRAPTQNEWFIDRNGNIAQLIVDNWESGPRVILKKKWQWPEWLLAPYIAKNNCNEWHAHNEKPMKTDEDWYSFQKIRVYPGLIKIEFPEVDWENSLMARKDYINE